MPNIDLYSLNKQAVKSMPFMDAITLNLKAKTINDWNKNFKYALLYCKDIGYFTLFAQKDNNADMPYLGTAVLDILHDFEGVYSIEEVDGSLEIWFKQSGIEDPMAMYLMDWTEGVITYEK